jgi:hypothetical protein
MGSQELGPLRFQRPWPAGPATPAHAQSARCARRDRGRCSPVAQAATARRWTTGRRVWPYSNYEM